MEIKMMRFQFLIVIWSFQILAFDVDSLKETLQSTLVTTQNILLTTTLELSISNEPYLDDEITTDAIIFFFPLIFVDIIEASGKNIAHHVELTPQIGKLISLTGVNIGAAMTAFCFNTIVQDPGDFSEDFQVLKEFATQIYPPHSFLKRYTTNVCILGCSLVALSLQTAFASKCGEFLFHKLGLDGRIGAKTASVLSLIYSLRYLNEQPLFSLPIFTMIYTFSYQSVNINPEKYSVILLLLLQSSPEEDWIFTMLPIAITGYSIFHTLLPESHKKTFPSFLRPRNI
jgi:hypothetical protein